MSVRLMVAVAALIAGLMLPARAEAESLRVTAGLNLRTGPGVGYAPIMVIPGGGWVELIGYSGGWCEVEWAGYRGWVFCRYLAGVEPPGYYYPEPAAPDLYFDFSFGRFAFDDEREPRRAPRKPRRHSEHRFNHDGGHDRGSDKASDWQHQSGGGEERWTSDDGLGDWHER